MKLKDTFVTQEMDGEQVMVEADGGFKMNGLSSCRFFIMMLY